VTGDVVRIPLVGTTKAATIDAADAPYLLQWTWRLHSQGYACRHVSVRGRKSMVLMHRVVTAAPQGQDVDHIDHDVLNNRRANLRVVSRSMNLAAGRLPSNNTSGVRGVQRSGNGWQASYRLDKKRTWLGHYATVEAAADALDRARIMAGLPPARRRHDAPLPEPTWRHLRMAERR
jgi:hypothetical protein